MSPSSWLWFSLELSCNWKKYNFKTLYSILRAFFSAFITFSALFSIKYLNPAWNLTGIQLLTLWLTGIRILIRPWLHQKNWIPNGSRHNQKVHQSRIRFWNDMTLDYSQCILMVRLIQIIGNPNIMLYIKKKFWNKLDYFLFNNLNLQHRSIENQNLVYKDLNHWQIFLHWNFYIDTSASNW